MCSLENTLESTAERQDDTLEQILTQQFLSIQAVNMFSFKSLLLIDHENLHLKAERIRAAAANDTTVRLSSAGCDNGSCGGINAV